MSRIKKDARLLLSSTNLSCDKVTVMGSRMRHYLINRNALKGGRLFLSGLKINYVLVGDFVIPQRTQQNKLKMVNVIKY